jgi:hypothetical protein
MKRAAPRSTLVLFGLLAACGTVDDPSIDYCVVQGTIEPAVAPVGAEVVFRGGPVSTVPDTLVRVGGVSADVLDVTRADCTFCDACLSSSDCDPCGSTCADCDAICASCVETITFVVPPVTAGDAPVVIQNLWGATDPIPFEAQEPADTGYTGTRRRRHQGFRLPGSRPFTR